MWHSEKKQLIQTMRHQNRSEPGNSCDSSFSSSLFNGGSWSEMDGTSSLASSGCRRSWLCPVSGEDSGEKGSKADCVNGSGVSSRAGGSSRDVLLASPILNWGGGAGVLGTAEGVSAVILASGCLDIVCVFAARFCCGCCGLRRGASYSNCHGNDS